MKLIIGLGNPGDKYANTRHNAGFLAIDHLQEEYGFPELKREDKFKCYSSSTQLFDDKVFLLKPQTFMNLSGESIRLFSQYYKIPVEDIIIMYDDVDIPFGSLRIRDTGSAGGHNGLKSIISELGTSNFLRLRLGIKPEIPFKGALEDYVLGQFSGMQLPALKEVIHQLPDVLKELNDNGLKSAMNRYN